jgi:type IV pilus assembly protein PilC
MPNFIFKARDWNGKLVQGRLDAADKKQVLISIKDSDLIPISVEKRMSGIVEEINKKILGKVGLKQISNFTRQLSTMMTAGLALTDSLSLLKNQSKETSLMFEILDHALTRVQGGEPLGGALEKYKNIFGEAYIASIKAGEEGGVLDEILKKLAANLEEEEEFKGKIKGAMVYPIIVIIGMIIVTFIMMIFVVPKMMGLYGEFGSEMPMTTRVLISISTTVSKFWFLFPLLVVGLIVFFKKGDKSKNFRKKRDKLLLKIPIMGELTKKTIIANTIRTLSMLLSAGISLVDALRITASVADNEHYFDAYLKITERVQKGFNIASSFEETGVFPIVVTQMVATGEATGKLDEVLLRVSNFFKIEAEQSVKTLTAAIEPLIMIVLGVGVGFLVIAVIMPIYNLTSQF